MTQMIRTLLRHLRRDMEVRILVPTRDRSGRPLSMPELASAVADRLSAISGGATTLAGRGTWNDGTKVVHERVRVVFTHFGTKVTSSQRLRLGLLIEELVKEADQAALAIAVGGRLFIIPGPRRARQASAMKLAAGRKNR